MARVEAKAAAQAAAEPAPEAGEIDLSKIDLPIDIATLDADNGAAGSRCGPARLRSGGMT